MIYKMTERKNALWAQKVKQHPELAVELNRWRKIYKQLRLKL